MRKTILLLIIMAFLNSNIVKATPLVDCGLTYFYDAAGNRIMRMVVACGPPAGKTNDTTSAAANQNSLPTDSTVLSTFQIVMIAPNPTAGPVTISCNEDLNNASVTVSDINGQIVQRSVANGRSIQMDISKLTAGSYTVVVTSNGAETAKTVIKMH